MSKEFQVEVLTPSRQLFKDKASEVVLPAYDGECGVLPDHGDFVGLLGTGVLKIRREGAESYYFIGTGAYQVTAGKLTIFAEQAEETEDIDLQAAKSRVAELEAVFADHEKFSPTDYDSQLSEYQEQQARIEVCQKSREG